MIFQGGRYITIQLFIIYGIILPIDFHIFQDGWNMLKPPTSGSIVMTWGPEMERISAFQREKRGTLTGWDAKKLLEVTLW